MINYHRSGKEAIGDRTAPGAWPICVRSYWWPQWRRPVKEISPLQVLIRSAGRFAAVSGVVALLVWVTWVMLDVSHMQSGFTLPD